LSDISSINQRIIADVKTMAASGKRVVFVAGNFNTVHPGHLRLLRFAAKCGDYLVVGVADDRMPGVMVPQALRLDGIKAIGFVNCAFVMHASVEKLIGDLKPAVVVKGGEHESHFNPEQAAVDA